MSDVGQIERRTQKRVVKLFVEQLGYEFGGNREDLDNANIDQDLLKQNLLARNYDEEVVTRAIHELVTASAVGGGTTLYDASHRVYNLLRYGAKVKRSVSDNFETIRLIEWDRPSANHFVIREEVTIKGEHTKRPDLVLYVNGIALVVIELKRSHVSASEGIRQNIGNQKQSFVRPFFSTVQLLFAGNDVEGLRYAVTETEEKYWLEWKEPSEVKNPLDRSLLQMTSKDRLLELIHDFIVYDDGTKKTARHNQYFGVKAAQKRVRERDGGIIWHTQGSGKSLTMVWLAKWIRENESNARVLIITDREELDEQIGGSYRAGGRKGIFAGVGETIHRATTGSDLIATLNASQPWLISSLIHKFGGDNSPASDENKATDDYISELKARLPVGFKAKGNVYVFVDEAHRTQSGKLHRAMKAVLPDAMFIGFTGTPLLKADKATSLETFGPFIHTYKFDEAVSDGVVLDLRYEARNIGQELKGEKQIDQWFDNKTKGLTDLSKARLRKQWGTMQKVFSAKSRTSMIVQDILTDFDEEPRLISGRGNAMLVSQDVYQACNTYELFVQAGYKGKVAIITSYEPSATGISKEDAGTGDNEEIRKYDVYRQMLADYFQQPADEAVKRIDEFETDVKRRFVEEPGQMRLLIVVDKLLTGFDAPSATYLYIDKSMRDHGLFQAICRVNRLDGDDKTYGYVIDYRDLFNSIGKAISDYTSGALDGYDETDVVGLLKDRVEHGRIDLDDALEKIRALCEAVQPPKGTIEYQHYFVSGVPGDSDQIKHNEPKRIELYRSVASLVRAYGAIANDMEEAGYAAADIQRIKADVKHYVAVRDEVELGAGENVDLKQFEAGMRSLLDTYIQADPVEHVASFKDGLVQLIVDNGAEALKRLPMGIQSNPQAVAETIINNVRKTIVDEHGMNPKYYDKMSSLLDALIAQRRKDAIDYAQYLDQLLELAKQVGTRQSDDTYPAWATSSAKRALVDFGFPEEVDIPALHAAVQSSKEHGWSDNLMKQRALARSLRAVLPEGFEPAEMDRLIALLGEQDEYR
jgi:type I restriction enzyme, R subunit